VDIERPKAEGPRPKAEGPGAKDENPASGGSTDPGDYCRAIEAYLCRKNDGHLIRIVGPSFERVCAWAERGIPTQVAFQGIDRYFERYYAKPGRRRPVLVDFCEADVLDVFDEWRRAVGVWGAGGGDTSEDSARRTALPAHLDRVIARLTALRARADRALDAELDAVVQELDAARAGAKALRGARRQELLARLVALDARLLASARQQLAAESLEALRHQADAELAPFRSRLSADAYQRSHAACVDRLIREHARLPTLTL
jgi:uncharacterized membrane-anchored protein YhcB (DUF1043 family)